ncbi:MAG: hypothetical protein JO264_16610 [Acidisphaera sp.]|nr:hypothetical protein [Acidisphaera sp.]
MQWVEDTLRDLAGVFVYFVQLGAAVLAWIELFLRSQLQAVGIAPVIQTILIVAIEVLILLAALNLLRGLIRVLVVIFLVLLGIHVLAPLIPA